MPSTRTLSSVRTSVRDHIDEPTANYWSDAECNRAIGQRQLDLWRRILQLDKDFFLAATPATLTLVASTFAYTLPTDFFRATAIRTTTSGQELVTWRAADPNSAEFTYLLRSDVAIASPSEYLYAIRNVNTIWVAPLPQATLTARVDYIQQPTQVSSDSDTFIIPDAFLDYVEYAATSDLLSKGPVGDPSFWGGKASEAWQNILLALDSKRQDQNADVVLGMFEGMSG